MSNQDQFMEQYHKRSNVESTFSMIKANFGERLRSKTKTAQINEVLGFVAQIATETKMRLCLKRDQQEN
jgi:transposase